MTAPRQSMRPAPEGHVALPTLKMSDWSRPIRWWSPEAGIPRRCPACRARLLVEPPLWERFGRVVCGIDSGCGREYAWVSSTGWEL